MIGRNGALDVLRAAAILMVLACHFVKSLMRDTFVAEHIGVCGRGVELFFVLSGWLLGNQLFKERNTTGSIDVLRFWLRRWLRTIPAYYAILGLTFAQLLVTGRGHLIDPGYLIFIQNYYPKLPYFGISWSLCVEEHFYLVIAPAIWLINRSRVWLVLGFALLIGLLIIHALGWYGPQDEFGLTTISHIRFEQCLIGVLLAWVAQNRPHLWQQLVPSASALAGLGLVFFSLAFLRKLSNWMIPDWGLIGWGLIFASWVFVAVTDARFMAIRWRGLEFIATRAYSLYLVHIEAIAVAAKLTFLPPVVQVLVAFVVTFLAAEFLHRLIERPVMNLRDKWSSTRNRPVTLAADTSKTLPAPSQANPSV
ncbi:MAG: acyltransferase family protein [Gemmataceae bacterium]